MPRDIIVENPTANWDRLLGAVDSARAENQSEEDTWCVVGVNGAHILTVWSKPHSSGQQGVRPSNHAEERLVTLYSQQFQHGFQAQARTRNYVAIFLKKSPCNYGTGSCYDMLRRFLLDYRSDHSDADRVVIIYDWVYSGYKRAYFATSWQAIEEFRQIRGCDIISWEDWDDIEATSYGVAQAPAPKNENTRYGPTPVQLPSDMPPREQTFVRLDGKKTETIVLGKQKSRLFPLDNQPAWVKRYLIRDQYQVVLEESILPPSLLNSIEETMQKYASKALTTKNGDNGLIGLAFGSLNEQCLFIAALADLQK